MSHRALTPWEALNDARLQQVADLAAGFSTGGGSGPWAARVFLTRDGDAELLAKRQAVVERVRARSSTLRATIQAMVEGGRGCCGERAAEDRKPVKRGFVLAL